MKEALQLILVAVLSIAMAFGTVSYVTLHQKNTPAVATALHETTFQRVMRTGTLRCAYTNYPPLLIIDPNTKQISGVYHDITEDIAKRAALKVEWTEEVGYGNINAGFVAGRYDAFCSPLWPTAIRAKDSLFTSPLYFSPVFVWVRPDDSRFDGDISKLNDAHYTFVIFDGDVMQSIADKDFPLAHHLALPQSSGVADKIQNVITGKADAFADELSTGQQFLAHNPGALKNATPNKPIRVYPNTLMLPFGEHDLKNVLDTSIGELNADGTIENIIKKYMGANSPFYFVGKSYQAQ